MIDDIDGLLEGLNSRIEYAQKRFSSAFGEGDIATMYRYRGKIEAFREAKREILKRVIEE